MQKENRKTNRFRKKIRQNTWRSKRQNLILVRIARKFCWLACGGKDERMGMVVVVSDKDEINEMVLGVGKENISFSIFNYFLQF